MTEARELRLHRKLLLAGGGGYLVWWVFVRLALPDAFNPLGSRLFAVSAFFAVWGLSYVSGGVRKNIDLWFAGAGSVGTAHYFYLLDQNHADSNWVVGSYITVTAVCAIMQTSRSLLSYSAFVALVSLAMLRRSAGATYVVFLPGMLTTLLFANIGLVSKLRLLARLRESLGEQKRAETALLRANKDLESFSYSIAHDLRTPLRGINGFSRVLREDYGDRLDEEAKRHLERIGGAAETMGRLIDGLLDLSRMTRKAVERGAVDLTKQAEEVATELEMENSARVVEVDVQEDVIAQGDASLLRALLANLLGNAWKFTERRADARISFGCELKDGARVYFVKDNGVGFDMAHASKLFGVFQRLHGANEYAGTGIGLATVQRIVERHGGRVWAEAAVGEGAAFYFTLEP